MVSRGIKLPLWGIPFRQRGYPLSHIAEVSCMSRPPSRRTEKCMPYWRASLMRGTPSGGLDCKCLMNVRLYFFTEGEPWCNGWLCLCASASIISFVYTAWHCLWKSASEHSSIVPVTCENPARPYITYYKRQQSPGTAQRLMEATTTVLFLPIVYGLRHISHVVHRADSSQLVVMRDKIDYRL